MARLLRAQLRVGVLESTVRRHTFIQDSLFGRDQELSSKSLMQVISQKASRRLRGGDHEGVTVARLLRGQLHVGVPMLSQYCEALGQLGQDEPSSG